MTESNQRQTSLKQAIRIKSLIRFCLIGPSIPSIIAIIVTLSHFILAKIFSLLSSDGLGEAMIVCLITIVFSFPVGGFPALISALVYAKIIILNLRLIKGGKSNWILNVLAGAISGLSTGITIDLLIYMQSINSFSLFFTVCSALSASFCAILTRRSLLNAFPGKAASNV